MLKRLDIEGTVILKRKSAWVKRFAKVQNCTFSYKNKASYKVLFALAEETIRQIRSMCPELMADALLRVDFFVEPLPDGTF